MAAESRSLGPILPSFSSTKTTSDFKIRIAVDFGTDGIALAYAMDTEQVFVHEEWANGKYQTRVKEKTIILLDEKAKNYKVLQMGITAKYNYATMPEFNDKWLLFERFKMALFDGSSEGTSDDEKDYEKDEGKMAIKRTLKAANGTEVESRIVFVAAFKKIKELANDLTSKAKLKRIKDKDIQWIITVPAIWNDEAKYMMRQWAIEGGLVDPKVGDQCKIVYEPDCASLSMQQEARRMAASADGNEGVEFKKGERYILVDAGGGTVDIACHEITGGTRVKEVLHPSGGPWGSCYIDDQFGELLNCLFSAEWVDKFKKQHPDFWIELIDNFQASKQDFYKEHHKIHNVRVPWKFLNLMQHLLEKSGSGINDLEKFIATKSVFDLPKNDGMVVLTEDLLEIHTELWGMMFDKVMDPTIAHTKSLLSNPKMKRCKYLCLAGGLSTSPYFQQRMTDEFGPKSAHRMQVVIPERPILSVVEGAALMGVTPDFVSERVLRYTYGQLLDWDVSTAKKCGLPEQYIKDNTRLRLGGRSLVSNCFEVMARKGDSVKIGEVKICKAYRQPGAKTTTTYVVYSSAVDPKIASDGKELGKIEKQWTEDADDMETILEFHFYETLIKVVCYRTKEPDIKHVRYVNNYE